MRVAQRIVCACVMLALTTGCPSRDTFTIRIVNRASDVVITKVYMEDTSGPSIDTTDYLIDDVEFGRNGHAIISIANVDDFGPDSVLVIGSDGAKEVSAIIYTNYSPGGSVNIRVYRDGGEVKFQKV